MRLSVNRVFFCILQCLALQNRLRGTAAETTLQQWPQMVHYSASRVQKAECADAASVVTGGSQAVLIHQITKHQTQAPFKRSKGRIISQVAFHPSKPQFFVAVSSLSLLAPTACNSLRLCSPNMTFDCMICSLKAWSKCCILASKCFRALTFTH